MVRLLSPFERLYYKVTGEILDSSRAPCQLGIWPCFLLSVFLYSTRTLYLVYVIENDFTCPYNFLEYDLVLTVFYRNSHVYDSFILVIVYLFSCFYFTCEYLIWRLPVAGKLTWRCWHEIGVENTDAYLDCLLQGPSLVISRERKIETTFRWLDAHLLTSFLHKSVKQLIAKYLANLILFIKSETLDFEKLASRPLSTLPNVSVGIRSKMAVFLVTLDWFLSYVQPLFIITYWLFFTSILSLLIPDWFSYPFPVWMWLFLEIIFVFLCLSRMLRYAVYFTVSSLVGTYLATVHLTQMFRPIENLLKKPYLRRVGLHLSRKWLVDRFLVEHTRLGYIVLTGNEALFGQVMYAFLLSNMPINIYLLTRILLRKNTVGDLVLCWIIWIVQLLSCLFVFLSLSYASKRYHEPERMIPNLQGRMVGKAWRVSKLKYDQLYGGLTCSRIAVSIGPIKAVTYWTTFEFFLTYIAYLLMAFSQVIDSQHGEK